MRDFLLISGSFHSRIALIDKNSGETIWQLLRTELPWVEVNDADIFPDGDIVFAARMETGTPSFVRRIRPDYQKGTGYQTIWNYEIPLRAENHTSQVLKDGRVLIAECYPECLQLKELDDHGKPVVIVGDETNKIPYFDYTNSECSEALDAHMQLRQATKSEDGTYLLGCFWKEHTIEIDRNIHVIADYPHGFAYSVVPDKEGNLIIGQCDKKCVVCIKRSDGSLVWKIEEKDLPGIVFGFVACVRPLPNGNILLCNWDGHGGAKGAPIVEVEPFSKRVVWSLPTNDKMTISNVRLCTMK